MLTEVGIRKLFFDVFWWNYRSFKTSSVKNGAVLLPRKMREAQEKPQLTLKLISHLWCVHSSLIKKA